MIDLHYWTTPNSLKISMFMEETGTPHRLVHVNLGKNEQFAPEYLKIAPHNKAPAIVDHEPKGGGAPITIFESGAILQYLGEKTGKLLPADTRGKFETLQWVYWQVSSIAPMSGQVVFFKRSAPTELFSLDRYQKETAKLWRILDTRLSDRPYLAGNEYSIADIATYSWTALYDLMGQNIDDFPHAERWLDSIAARPATQRAYATAKEINPNLPARPAPRNRK